MAQFKFSQKLEIKMPTVEGKAETKKMQLAVNKALSKGAQKGATYVQSGLRDALNAALESSHWTGFNPKYPYSRKNGQLMGSGPRDIVDTGALRASLKITEKFSQTKVGFQIAYTTPYAAFVHYGGVIQPYGNPRAASVIIPARPWVEGVLYGTHGVPKFDMVPFFDKGVQEAWTAQFG